VKLLIRGGRIIDPAQAMDKVTDILVINGKVETVANNIEAREGMKEIDAEGLIVCPGLIDVHTHLREPGQEHKETVFTGAAAAAAGGYTAVCAMPNTDPVADNQTVVSFVKQRGINAQLSRVYPIAAITKGSQGQELTEVGDLVGAGAVALSDDGQPVMNAAVMRRALEYTKLFSLPIVSHAEDKTLSAGGVMHEGEVSTRLGLSGIPALAEEVAVMRDILLAEATGGQLHLAHISTVGAVNLVRQAKLRGANITAEAAPHHFSLTHQAVDGYHTDTKVNPPLRTEADVEAVIKGLSEGTLDVIATDHAPHSMEEKDVEFDLAPFGLVGLETALALVVSKLIRPGHLNWTQAVTLLSTNPARIFKLPGGTLTPGSEADITIINPDLERTVTKELFKSKGRNTPFDGWKLQGWAEYTIVSGKIIFQRNSKEG